MGRYDASIRVHTDVDTRKLKEAEKEVERLAKKLDSVRQRSAKLEALGGTEKQFASLGYDAEMLENQLADATTRVEQLTTEGFDKAEKSAKKCFKTVEKGANKTNKSFNSTSRVLKNIVLSMVAFQAIFKGAEYIASGFKNLAQYSTELNGVFSDLKSETATLKNSLATAFEPIVLQIVPWLTSLVSALNTAMNALSQFWAYLGGKSTYTRAKKQVIDYAKSVKEASKTAKGALASFDELNVLNKNDGTGNGGELSGADAFEEVAVDESQFKWVEWLKDNLWEILTLVTTIGIGILAWKISDAFSLEFSKVAGIAFTVAGAFVFLKGSIDALQNGVNWSNLSTMLIGAAVMIGGLGIAFGPLGAAIGGIIAGITMFGIALYDILANGITAENGVLLLASAVTLLVGVFAIFGGTATIVVGVIMAVVGILAALVAYGGNGAEVLEHLKNTFKSLGDFVSKVFAGDMEGAFESLKDAGRSFGNFFISIAEGIANGFIRMVNAAIDAINTLSFDVPGWLQEITGMKTFGFNIPHWDAKVEIPRLATGGIVTSSTLANIGEAGREAVLPLDNNTEWMDTLSDKINTSRGPVVIKFEGSLAELGRVLKPVIDSENTRVGNVLVVN